MKWVLWQYLKATNYCHSFAQLLISQVWLYFQSVLSQKILTSRFKWNHDNPNFLSFFLSAFNFPELRGAGSVYRFFKHDRPAISHNSHIHDLVCYLSHIFCSSERHSTAQRHSTTQTINMHSRHDWANADSLPRVCCKADALAAYWN